MNFSWLIDTIKQPLFSFFCVDNLKYEFLIISVDYMITLAASSLKKGKQDGGALGSYERKKYISINILFNLIS